MKREFWGRWAKRAGIAGFLFFLVKGLVWLSVTGLAVVWLG